MRPSLAILLAAATAITASAASFAPAQAAPVGPMPVAGDQQTGVELIRDRERWGGDWDRGHDNDGWRHHRRHHRHHRYYRDDFGSFPGFSFSFGFPQAYYQPRRYYQPYYGYGDCFRTWDGQLICR